MSGRHSNHTNDTLVCSDMLSHAVAALLKCVTLDCNHDIPYLAGYSIDRTIIYIDRHLGRRFVDHLGRSHEVDKFLVLHEATEKALIDCWKLHYQHAHQIALRAEEAAVRAAGIEWRDYDRFMQQWIKRADSAHITQVPANLDLTPYLDENDVELIKAMQRAMVA
jgi:hypothetical protein